MAGQEADKLKRAGQDANKKFGDKRAGAPVDLCPRDVTVTVELQMAFSLSIDRFRHDDVTWPDVPYDIEGLLKELYPGHDLMTWRLAGRHGKPVVGAVLTVVGTHTRKDPAPTNGLGKTKLDLLCPAGGDAFVAVRVAPPPGQLNATKRPAGPALTDEHTTAEFLFRPFTLVFAVDKTGALLQDEIDVLPDKLDLSFEGPRDPAYVRIIESTKGTAPGSNLIVVDWRPDWMVSGTEKRAKSRRYDTRDVPINPWDNSHTKQDRLTRAPPVVTIHQTSTHHLSFLPGFIKNPFLGPNAKGEIVMKNEESIHYLVDVDGFVVKVLDELYRANHAGHSAWEQRVAANDFTVGIETLHTDGDPPASEGKLKLRRFTREQYEAIIRLLAELTATYPLRGRRVLGHMEVIVTDATPKADNFVEGQGAPAVVTNGTISRDRVDCPGPFFEWQRLEEAGVALGLAPVPATSPDPTLAATFAELPTLASVTVINKSGPEAKLIKQLLFDIGYSVIKTPRAYTDRKDLAAIRASITEALDDLTHEAVRAFQTHHFSGRRRKYKIVGNNPPGGKPAGTLDRDTIDAIQQKWFAAMTEG